ncbi:MAG TPA: hypothetical protein VL978_01155, partial [Puia sp.]|nr:hypothetical protein [Puia sp.]
QLIKSIAAGATISNHSLLRDPSFSHHLLYRLKGTQRLWPHRVNSLRRFRYLYTEFSGFECDIQFDPQTGLLSIGHDGPGPDSLTAYLKADTGQLKLFWLDLKNIRGDNAEALAARLAALDLQYNLKNRIILECYDTTAASQLRNKGWLTALNFIIHPVYPLSPDITLLTGETADHPNIAREFPGLKQLNWDISFWDGMNRTNLLEQANDTDLLVCLINVKSPGYR